MQGHFSFSCLALARTQEKLRERRRKIVQYSTQSSLFLLGSNLARLPFITSFLGKMNGSWHERVKCIHSWSSTFFIMSCGLTTALLTFPLLRYLCLYVYITIFSCAKVLRCDKYGRLRPLLTFDILLKKL